MEKAMTDAPQLYFDSFSSYGQHMDERVSSYSKGKSSDIFLYAVKACPSLSALASHTYGRIGTDFIMNPDNIPKKLSDFDDGIAIHEHFGYDEKKFPHTKEAQTVIYAITDPTRLDIDFQSNSPEQVIANIRDSVKKLGGKTSPELEKDMKLVEDNIKQNFASLKAEQLQYRSQIIREYGETYDFSISHSESAIHDGLDPYMVETLTQNCKDSPLLSQLAAPTYKSEVMNVDKGYFSQVNGVTPGSGPTYIPEGNDKAVGIIMDGIMGERSYVEAPKARQDSDATVYDPMPPKQYNVELIKSVKMLGGNPDNPALKAEIEKVQELYKTNWDAVEKNKVDSKKQELDELRQKLGGRGVKVSDASDLNSGANLVFAGFQKQSQALEV